MVELKAVDMLIVKTYMQDSRISLKTVAERFSLHPSTVAYRLKKLREAGIIRRFTISVDWRKLGKTVEAAVMINCSPKNVTKVASILKSMDEVIEVHSLTGFYDILAMVTLKDMEEYRVFIEKRLGVISEIENIRAGIVLEDFKEE
ncbi:MAG: Lrp/AsnC family transcriptional regulator, regulator for asnA, asnC and gidA [Thermoproteota archaeon]|nr:Lrp/AsnC family transcriptional regulator, regulator for asnA, asnC and gidA [Thermoproteota archaeon]